MPARLATTFESALPSRARLQRAAAYLDSLPFHERRSIMKRLAPTARIELERPGARALDWHEVQEMARRGMSFGACGVTLTTMTRLTASDALREMRRSMQRVALQVGRPVRALAYPNGVVDDDVVRLAAEAGAQVAFTREVRDNRQGDDPLRLGRRPVQQASSTNALGSFSRAVFWCEVTGLFDRFRLRARGSKHDTSQAGFHRLEWTGPPENVQRIGATASHSDVAPTPAAARTVDTGLSMLAGRAANQPQSAAKRRATERCRSRV